MAENKREQALALLYLEWLATQLEDAGNATFDTSDLPATANEGAE